MDDLKRVKGQIFPREHECIRCPATRPSSGIRIQDDVRDRLIILFIDHGDITITVRTLLTDRGVERMPGSARGGGGGRGGGYSKGGGKAARPGKSRIDGDGDGGGRGGGGGRGRSGAESLQRAGNLQFRHCVATQDSTLEM